MGFPALRAALSPAAEAMAFLPALRGLRRPQACTPGMPVQAPPAILEAVFLGGSAFWGSDPSTHFSSPSGT